MKKMQLFFLLLIAFVLNAAEQATPYVLTEFPLAILPADSSVWIKWSGLSSTGGPLVDSGGVIYFSREPGGSSISNYEGRVLPGETIEDNISFTDKEVQERGIKFRPSDVSAMESGIYYLMVAYSDGIQTYYSNEIKFIVRSPDKPQLISPIGSDVSDVTPTFEWQKVADVPYYHIIVTDEAVVLNDDNSLEGLSIIWQAITDGTQMVYGAPDPSGTISASPPPLSPGVTYSWFVLNNYGNNPAMTALDVVIPSQFSLVGDTMNTPLPIAPDNGDTLNSADYETKPFTLTWTNLDTNANTYKAYLYTASEDSNFSAQIAMWDGEVTAGSFGDSDTGSIELDAKNILTTNTYTWKVIAVDSKGYGQASSSASFYYQSKSGGALVRTYETIQTGAGSVEQTVGLCEIQVEVLDGSMEPPLLFYTDGNGYLYRSRPVGTYRFTAVKDGYTSATKTVTVTENDTAKVTIYLERPDASVYGKIVDSNEKGIISASVKAISTLGDTVTTETDPEGNFVVNCGKGDWDIYASKTGYTTPLPERISVDFGESKSLTSSIVLVNNSFVISGIVSNESGEALVAANVKLKDENGVLVNEVPSTSSSGLYNFSVNPGIYTLSVSKTGFSSYSETFTITSTLTRNVSLAAGAAQITGSIFGRNWSFEGTQTVAAIRDMAVEAYDADGKMVASATTDSWGAFTLGVPGGFVRYTLKYSAGGYEPDSGLTENISSGVTYTFTDTLVGFANLRGTVRESGTTTSAGDIQISLVDTLTGEVFATGQSDNAGESEFYSIEEGVYQIIAAGDGMFADTIGIRMADNSFLDIDLITVSEGRIYVGDALIDGFEITVAEGAGSILWISNAVGSGEADVKVITPLITKVSGGDTLFNVGLGEYRIEVDAIDDSVLDCSKHLTTVSENGVLLTDSVGLPFTHVALDSTQQTGTTTYLDVRVDSDLLGSKTVSSAKIYYKDYNGTEFQSSDFSSNVDNIIRFAVTPPKTGSYLEYYFEIILSNGNVYGYSKEVERTFIKPDMSLITRLELVPATDTSGYVMPNNGTMRFELRGYYGDNFTALDPFAAANVTWSSTGPLSLSPAAGDAYVMATSTGPGAASVTARFNTGATYSLGDNVDPVVSQKVTVTDGILSTISVALVSLHGNKNYITNSETAQYAINAFDSKGNNVSVIPDWTLFPDTAGEISHDGIFTPAVDFSGRVQIVASVNDTIRADYYENSEAELPGMLVGYTVQPSTDTVMINDGFELSMMFPESSSTGPVVVAIEHPVPKNTVYKTVPQEGVSLISRIFEIKRLSDTKFRSDSIFDGADSISRASRIRAYIKVPKTYWDYVDASGSRFSIGVWSEDSLSWSHKWKPREEDNSRAALDSLPSVLPTLEFNSADSTFSVEVGDTLNSQGTIKLALLFNESEEVHAGLIVSPNPFSPYVAPMNDYVNLPGMTSEHKGTCIKITPMSSTSGNNPNVKVNIYTSNRTLVWEALLNNALPGKDYYLFWDGRTRRGRGKSGDIITVAENTPIRPIGNEMCRNGRYFAVVTIDDGKTEKRFTKEIILFK